MKVLHRLWVEDGGFVISTEAIVILTMIICATVVGWQAVREAVVSELADIGAAIAAIDQSYSYAGFEGHSAACHGSFFDDGPDFCDDTDCVQDNPFSRCIIIQPNRAKESDPVNFGSGGAASDN